MPGRTDVALASMGIYVFNPDLLERLLIEDTADEKSKHDFGKDIIPKAIEKLQVFAYPFRDVKTRAQSYWRDVGTIDAFYEANLELVWVNPELNIYDEDWPIWTYQAQTPPAKFVLDEEGRRGIAINSLVSGGVIISGATVRESLLFSGVRVEERSTVERSVILPDVRIGPNCQIRNAILDAGCEVAGGTRIGFDRGEDAKRFLVTEKGVVLVTPDMLAMVIREPMTTRRARRALAAAAGAGGLRLDAGPRAAATVGGLDEGAERRPLFAAGPRCACA